MKIVNSLVIALALGTAGASSAAMATANVASISNGASFVSASSAINLSGYDDGIAANNILSDVTTPAYYNGDTRYIFSGSDNTQDIIIDLGSTYSLASFGATFNAVDRTPTGLNISVSSDGMTFTPVDGTTASALGGSEYVFTPTGKVNATYVEYIFGAPANEGTGSGITRLVADVPEPATWAMMLVGMGMVGFAVRRRAKVTSSYA